MSLKEKLKKHKNKLLAAAALAVGAGAGAAINNRISSHNALKDTVSHLKHQAATNSLVHGANVGLEYHLRNEMHKDNPEAFHKPSASEHAKEFGKRMLASSGIDVASHLLARAYVNHKYKYNPFVDKSRKINNLAAAGSNIANTAYGLSDAARHIVPAAIHNIRSRIKIHQLEKQLKQQQQGK